MAFKTPRPVRTPNCYGMKEQTEGDFASVSALRRGV